MDWSTTQTPVLQAHPKSDLERFVELYKSFGIELGVAKVVREGNKAIPKGSHIIMMEAADECTEIVGSQFIGYDGFYSRVLFDENGKFVSQGFWE